MNFKRAKIGFLLNFFSTVELLGFLQARISLFIVTKLFVLIIYKYNFFSFCIKKSKILLQIFQIVTISLRILLALFLDSLILYYFIHVYSGGTSVRNVTAKFGNSAGKIWQVLNEKGCLKKDELIQTTSLNEADFHKGIGWLARENKISRQQDTYKLENTNLESEIGAHAGRIWKILDIWGEADIETIKRLSDLNENQVHLAIGWLAKEDKIKLDEKKRFNLK